MISSTDEFKKYLHENMHKASRSFEYLSLLRIDIDNFEEILKEHPELKADTVIQEVGRIIDQNTRSTRPLYERDVLLNCGEGKFIDLLWKCNLTNATGIVCKRLVEYFNRNAVILKDIKLKMTISIGVAVLESGDALPDFLIERAERALQTAKSHGHGQIAGEESSA